MKKTMFILKYISVTAAFFTFGSAAFLLAALSGADFSDPLGVTVLKLLIISILYAISSPVSFSVKHFVRYSMTARLLIQTVINYPILIACSYLFRWMVTADSFYKITTVYFFAGMAAALFICLYYPKKYKLYNDSLNSYKKQALLDEYQQLIK